MKVFISHKKEDSTIAQEIVLAFRGQNVDAYLDVLDSTLECDGKELTDHIKANLNKCTDIIVVMSKNTCYSQWVPFEVGMSAQKDMPTATFLVDNVKLPDYLEYWPTLRSLGDIAKYVSTSEDARLRYIAKSLYEHTEYAESQTRTELFYELLKRKLNS